MIFVFLTVAPEGRETNLLEQKGELPRCHPLCSAGQFVEGIWKVGDLSFEDGERRKVGFDGSSDGPQRLHLTHILQTPHQRHRLQACPVSLGSSFCRQHTPKSKRQLSFVMASRNNRSLVPGQRLQRLSSSSKEAPVEKKPVSTTQLLQWKIQTNWTSHPKARRF